MKENDKERYWNPIVTIVENLRNSTADSNLIKQQYLQYRKDILLTFNKQFSSQ